MNSSTQILYDLVSAQSFSGAERPAAQVFVHHAKALGFDTHIDPVGNAIAHIGHPLDQAHTHIVLLGHIDTVPGDIPVRIDDGILHARGAVDAKGPLAAMLVAAAQTKLPNGVCITVAGAVGEEAPGSIGARYLVNQWQPQACIIAEPSGYDGITLGYKGRLLATINAKCPNTHSAGKDPSANDHLYAWWAQVLGRANEFNIKPTRTFDQIQASIHSTTSSCDGLYQHATINAGFRLPPAINPQEFALELQSYCTVELSITFDGAEQAYATTRNDPVVRALSSAIRAHSARPHPKLKTGTADLNVVAPIWKCPIAAYGPGDSSLDHTPIEHIHLDEYQRSISILTTAIESLALELIQIHQPNDITAGPEKADETRPA